MNDLTMTELDVIASTLQCSEYARGPNTLNSDHFPILVEVNANELKPLNDLRTKLEKSHRYIGRYHEKEIAESLKSTNWPMTPFLRTKPGRKYTTWVTKENSKNSLRIRVEMALQFEGPTPKLLQNIHRQSVEELARLTKELPQMLIKQPKIFYRMVKQLAKGLQKAPLVQGLEWSNGQKTSENMTSLIKAKLESVHQIAKQNPEILISLASR